MVRELLRGDHGVRGVLVHEERRDLERIDVLDRDRQRAAERGDGETRDARMRVDRGNVRRLEEPRDARVGDLDVEVAGLARRPLRVGVVRPALVRVLGRVEQHGDVRAVVHLRVQGIRKGLRVSRVLPRQVRDRRVRGRGRVGALRHGGGDAAVEAGAAREGPGVRLELEVALVLEPVPDVDDEREERDRRREEGGDHDDHRATVTSETKSPEHQIEDGHPVSAA